MPQCLAEHGARIGDMGGDLGTVGKLDVGEEALVALEQRAAHEGRREFHVAGP